MPERDVEVKFTTTFDGQGAEQAAESIKEVGDAAKQTAPEVKEQTEATKDLTDATDKLNTALTGLGVPFGNMRRFLRLLRSPWIALTAAIGFAVLAVKNFFDAVNQAAAGQALESALGRQTAAIQKIKDEFGLAAAAIEDRFDEMQEKVTASLDKVLGRAEKVRELTAELGGAERAAKAQEIRRQQAAGEISETQAARALGALEVGGARAEGAAKVEALRAQVSPLFLAEKVAEQRLTGLAFPTAQEQVQAKQRATAERAEANRLKDEAKASAQVTEPKIERLRAELRGETPLAHLTLLGGGETARSFKREREEQIRDLEADQQRRDQAAAAAERAALRHESVAESIEQRRTKGLEQQRALTTERDTLRERRRTVEEELRLEERFRPAITGARVGGISADTERQVVEAEKKIQEAIAQNTQRLLEAVAGAVESTGPVSLKTVIELEALRKKNNELEAQLDTIRSQRSTGDRP